MNWIKTLFWDVYALLYDTLVFFYPYKILQKKIVESLDPQNGDNILDAGCGTGNLIREILKASGDNVAIEAFDNSRSMVALAKKKITAKNVNISVLSLDSKLPYADGYFDKVSCINVLYALNEPIFALEELKRVTKRGGTIVIVNPVKRAGLLVLFKKHLNNAGLIQTLIIIPLLFLLGLFNLFIILLAKKNYFTFTDQIGVEKETYSGTIELIKKEGVYSDQANLYVLKKK